MTNAPQHSPGEDLPDWLRPPERRSHRRTLIIAAALTMLLLVSALLVVLLNGGDDQPPPPALSAPQSSPASSPPVPKTEEPPGSSQPRPAGRDEIRDAAQDVISGFNDRDSTALRSSSCDRSSITEDFFDEVPESVRFSLDDRMTVAGSSATVGYRITSKSGSVTHDGSMYLNWNGARWCLDYAT
ncbi:MAG: hypothetical protein GEU86_03620 [Actinophytocola sp.]|nr:hypothetical protein [Actinophytocola sp.]